MTSLPLYSNSFGGRLKINNDVLDNPIRFRNLSAIITLVIIVT